MTIGTSIFVFAVGAILRFAVTASVSGVDLDVVGTILMVAGAVGLAVGLVLFARATSRHNATHTTTHVDQQI